MRLSLLQSCSGPSFCTGSEYRQSGGCSSGRHNSHPSIAPASEGNLVLSGDHHDAAGTESQGSDPVADAVQIDQLSLHRNGIRTGDKQRAGKGPAAVFQLFLGREGAPSGDNDRDLRLLFQGTEDARLFPRSSSRPRKSSRAARGRRSQRKVLSHGKHRAPRTFRNHCGGEGSATCSRGTSQRYPSAEWYGGMGLSGILFQALWVILRANSPPCSSCCSMVKFRKRFSGLSAAKASSVRSRNSGLRSSGSGIGARTSKWRFQQVDVRPVGGSPTRGLFSICRVPTGGNAPQRPDRAGWRETRRCS